MQSYDNRAGNSLHGSQATFALRKPTERLDTDRLWPLQWIRIRLRGFDKCSPDMEEHWPRSASAKRPCCR